MSVSDIYLNWDRRFLHCSGPYLSSSPRTSRQLNSLRFPGGCFLSDFVHFSLLFLPFIQSSLLRLLLFQRSSLHWCKFSFTTQGLRVLVCFKCKILKTYFPQLLASLSQVSSTHCVALGASNELSCSASLIFTQITIL